MVSVAGFAQHLTPTACRLNAYDCRANAEKIGALESEFLALAEGWETLADQMELLDRERAELLLQMTPTEAGV